MPRKVFVNGNVLTDSDLNTYLMNQAVMTFADSTARSSAIGTATEGMVTYLEDSNSVSVWDGASWVQIYPVSAGDVSTSIGTLASTATAYTAVAADANNVIYSLATAAATVTIPDILALGERIDIVRDAAGTVTIAAGTGVSSWGGAGTAGTALTFKINEQYNAATVMKVAANTYRVIGKITA